MTTGETAHAAWDQVINQSCEVSSAVADSGMTLRCKSLLQDEKSWCFSASVHMLTVNLKTEIRREGEWLEGNLS